MYKRILAVAFIFLISVFLFAGCGKTIELEEINEVEPPDVPIELSEPELSSKGYVYDENLGFGFEYPHGWIIYGTEDTFSHESIKKNIIFEKKENMDGSEAVVSIELLVKTTTSLDEVTNEFINDSESSGVPILSENMIEVNDIVGSDILTGIPTWNSRQVTFVNDGMAYIFKYSSQIKFYNMYEEVFNDVISSFTVEGPND